MRTAQFHAIFTTVAAAECAIVYRSREKLRKLRSSHSRKISSEASVCHHKARLGRLRSAYRQPEISKGFPVHYRSFTDYVPHKPVRCLKNGLEQHCKVKRAAEPRGRLHASSMGEDSRIIVETSASKDEVGGDDTYTVEDAINAVGFGPFQALLMGYTGLAWISEAMELMLVSFVGREVAGPWGLSASQEAGIASAVFAGMMVGAYIWGILADLKGRRVGFFIPSFLTFIAGMLSAFSPNYWTLLVTRALVGVGLAAGPVIYALFMELVPSRNRGLWLVVVSAFWTLGAVGEALLAWAVLPHAELGWRVLVALSAFPLFLLLIFYPMLPESPRFDLAKGNHREALTTLRNIARINKKPLPPKRLVLVSDSLSAPPDPVPPRTPPAPPPTPPLTAGAATLRPTATAGVAARSVAELGTRKRQSWLAGSGRGGAVVAEREWERREDLGTRLLVGDAASAGEKGSSMGVLSVLGGLLSPGMRVPTLLLWGVFFSTAFTYYGVVLLTSQIAGGAQQGCDAARDLIVAAPGVPVPDAIYRDTLVASLGEVPGLLISALVIDRFGRKGSMVALFTATGFFLLPLVSLPGETMTTVLLFGARACIMGAFTILYVYAPEVYPTKNRSTGLGIANFFGRVGGLVCPLVAIDLVKSCNQPLAVSLFASISLLAGLAVVFFPLETRGRPLVEAMDVPLIDELTVVADPETDNGNGQ